jgi:DNA helicase HerA-like ATPase
VSAIEQTVRLIRSKGVGVFFVTQTPTDVPAGVLAQLGNRVQHALRAYTPQDAKALRATASTFPVSSYDLEELLTQLGTGEAVVTVLSERGAPTPVAWTRLRAPESLMAPAPAEVVDAVLAASALRPRYEQALDRESAYEKLNARLQAAPTAPTDPASSGQERTDGTLQPSEPSEPSMIEKVVSSSAFRSMTRSAATVIGREITRSLFGTARRRR